MSLSLADYYNAEGPTAVGLTFDTDWAPDFVLERILGELSARELSATFFCTNPSAALEKAATDPRIERALHPNFGPGSSHGASPEEVIQTLRGWFPEAIGIRSHSLVQSSPILRQLPELGIDYDCNLLLYDHPFLQVFGSFFDLVRVPYGWSDASFLHEDRPLVLEQLGLERPGLKVLDLHPMLVYLNVAEPRQPYEQVKALERDLTRAPKQAVDALVQRGDGVGRLFEALLDWIVDRGIRTYRLCDLVADFQAAAGQRPGRRAPFDFHRA